MICSRCGFDEPRESFGPSAELWPDRRVCKKCSDYARLRNPRHGITPDQKQQIAEHQGGCAICGHAEPGGKGWVVDHDRLGCCPKDKSCPKCRRGVICQWCNSVLGYAFDRRETLQKAIGYLDRHDNDPCAWHMPVACAPRICTGNDQDAGTTDARKRTYKNGEVQDSHINPPVSERTRGKAK